MERLVPGVNQRILNEFGFAWIMLNKQYIYRHKHPRHRTTFGASSEAESLP
jgi:hypothetical protein